MCRGGWQPWQDGGGNIVILQRYRSRIRQRSGDLEDSHTMKLSLNRYPGEAGGIAPIGSIKLAKRKASYFLQSRGRSRDGIPYRLRRRLRGAARSPAPAAPNLSMPRLPRPGGSRLYPSPTLLFRERTSCAKTLSVKACLLVSRDPGHPWRSRSLNRMPGPAGRCLFVGRGERFRPRIRGTSSKCIWLRSWSQRAHARLDAPPHTAKRLRRPPTRPELDCALQPPSRLVNGMGTRSTLCPLYVPIGSLLSDGQVRRRPGFPRVKRLAAARWLRERLTRPLEGPLRPEAAAAGWSWITISRALGDIGAVSERCPSTRHFRWRLQGDNCVRWCRQTRGNGGIYWRAAPFFNGGKIW
jgi:hypothetical protein